MTDKPCPNDTNGDGDCGMIACPHCGPFAAQYARIAREERNEAAMAASLLGIHRREKAATPGPWTLETEQGDAEYSVNPPYPYAIHGPVNEPYADAKPGTTGHEYRTTITDMTQLRMEDAEFIVHARVDVPRLLACAEALLDLVVLKDGPRDAEYAHLKPKAWEAAREAVEALLPKTEPFTPEEVSASIIDIRRALREIGDEAIAKTETPRSTR